MGINGGGSADDVEIAANILTRKHRLESKPIQSSAFYRE